MLTLETPRLRLTLPEPTRAAEVLAYFERNQAHLAPTNPALPPEFHTEAYWRTRLQQNIQEFQAEQSVRLFIETKAETKLIGVINFTQLARGPFQACYLGYSIDRAHEGQGLMREALEAAIAYIFEQRHFHRIMANHLPENSRSAAVLKRLGFRVDGESPNYLFISGRWRTHVLTSLTNERWTPREEDRALFALD